MTKKIKLVLDITSSKDSNNVKEYAVIIRGEFPITQYKRACILQDGILDMINKRAKRRKVSK